MSIRVALNHRTSYHFDRSVEVLPHVIRLRPAPHCRTPIVSYSLRVTPGEHFLNWQQDPQGNYQARLVFPKKLTELNVEVDLIADMAIVNPFDFFLEDGFEEYPFTYGPRLRHELEPFLEKIDVGERFLAYLGAVDRRRRRVIDFLVELNQRLQADVAYLVRMEPGVQTPDETLERLSGSCRDSAWLQVQVLRHLGIAARFVSGYLIQLTADEKSLDGPSGPATDFTDLHAWSEVYLPGAGWVGLDPTSGLLAGEGHIPLACTPEPAAAAPITGATSICETQFSFAMNIERIHEDPRVTKPYTEAQWDQIEKLGHQVDRRLEKMDVRLTMGGEPTFVSIDDRDTPEWNTAAVGPTKRTLAYKLLWKLREDFGPAGLMHFGQGKWYPGESLPRWSFTLYWRADGEPVWHNDRWIAEEKRNYGHTAEHARHFMERLAARLDVEERWIRPAYEDAFHYVHVEQRQPVNVDPLELNLKDAEERRRLAKVLNQGLNSVVGYTLPLQFAWWRSNPGWVSGPWPLRDARMLLIPGDSPLGLRLPLDSLPIVKGGSAVQAAAADPTAAQGTLPLRAELARPSAHRLPALAAAGDYGAAVMEQSRFGFDTGGGAGDRAGFGNGDHSSATSPEDFFRHQRRQRPDELPPGWFPQDVIRTALCVEPREGKLHVFMPPVERLEDYLALVAAIEDTCEETKLPVVIEGYTPPHDPRLRHIKVTPDPGVIEVNVHPSRNWDELVHTVHTLYDDARLTRLGTEKFDLDGRHTGTGGGNHVVLGGPTPLDSPFLRRPDLLKSLLGFWNNHPSLSYLFSGTFIGPTSQAPRVDETRRDGLYELKIAFEQIKPGVAAAPWLVDRVFRHLLVDVTGNTHRSEFCIDKLYSPDSATGRLGLVELRAFEMPPHYRMSLTQQLLVRSLVAKFWARPYEVPLVEWDTTLHDRFLLPHFVEADFVDVLRELADSGIEMDPAWFAPHFEFRFPTIGRFTKDNIQVELQTAIEPWYVLGEEFGGGGTARFVDSSVERLQIKVRGLTEDRYLITCNGRRVPLHPTGTQGEFVAGVRYRAWQPPSCLHPTIPVQAPLVFDLLDRWLERSLGGCTYHVSHPGGLSHERFPINAYEAEGRRAARFFAMGHTGGKMPVPPRELNRDFPFTLDLRKQESDK